jgi:hypothetical protein
VEEANRAVKQAAAREAKQLLAAIQAQEELALKERKTEERRAAKAEAEAFARAAEEAARAVLAEEARTARRAAEEARVARNAEREALARKAEQERAAKLRKAEELRAAEVEAALKAQAAADAKKAKMAEEARAARQAAEEVKAVREAEREAHARKVEENRLAKARKAEEIRAAEAKAVAKARAVEQAKQAKAVEEARAVRQAEREALARQVEEERAARRREAEELKAIEAEAVATARAEDDARQARAAEESRAARQAGREALARKAELARIAKAKRAEELRAAEAESAAKAREAEEARQAKAAAKAEAVRQAEREALARKAELERALHARKAEQVAASRAQGMAAKARAREREVERVEAASALRRAASEARLQEARREASEAAERDSETFQAIRQRMRVATETNGASIVEAETLRRSREAGEAQSAQKEVIDGVQDANVSDPSDATHMSADRTGGLTGLGIEQPANRFITALPSIQLNTAAIKTRPNVQLRSSTSLPTINDHRRPPPANTIIHSQQPSRPSAQAAVTKAERKLSVFSRDPLPKRPPRAFASETSTSAQKKLDAPTKSRPPVRAIKSIPLLPRKPMDAATPDLDALQADLDLAYTDRQRGSLELGSLSRRFENLGKQYLERNAPLAALECLQRAAKVAPYVDVASVLSTLSLAAMRLNRVDLAVRYLQDGMLKLAKTEGMHGSPSDSNKVRAKLLLNLCVVFNNSGRFHEALTAAEEAVGMLSHVALDDDQDDHTMQLVIGLYNVSTCYEQLSQFTKAHSAAQRALALSRGVVQMDSALMQRLDTLNEEVAAKQRDQLQRAGRKSRVHAWDLPTESRQAASGAEHVSRRFAGEGLEGTPELALPNSVPRLALSNSQPSVPVVGVLVPPVLEAAQPRS